MKIVNPIIEFFFFGLIHDHRCDININKNDHDQHQGEKVIVYNVTKCKYH